WIAACQRHVGQWQAVSVYAERPEVGGNQMRGKPCRGNAGRRFPVIQIPIPLPGGIGGPVGGGQPPDDAAPLVDENGAPPPPPRSSKGIRKSGNWGGCIHVFLKKAHPPRFTLTEECALIGGNAQAG